MSIVALAQSLADEHGTRDPFKICLNLGINVYVHELIECRGYYMRSFDEHYVTVAQDLPNLTQLFVCGHELAHFLLHQRMNRLFLDYRTRMEPMRFETEADKLSLHLMFGGEPLYQDCAIHEYQMAEMMNVKPCNLDSRLIELGLYW